MPEHKDDSQIAAKQWDESGSLQLYEIKNPQNWIQAEEGSYVDLLDMV